MTIASRALPVFLSVACALFPALALGATKLAPLSEKADGEAGWMENVWHQWKGYVTRMDGELGPAVELDLWGISTPRVPRGIWKFRFEVEHETVTHRYDADGKRIPVAPTLSFPDLFDPTDQRNVFVVDLQGENGGAHGFGYTVQIDYGLTDSLNWYLELPFQTADVQFDVRYTPGSLPNWEWGAYKALLRGIDLRTEAGFWQFLEAMGRRLMPSYRTSGLDMGDISAGVNWNYFSSKHFAVTAAGMVYFPTGYVPDPDNDIELFTGAGLPAGDRAWGLGTSQGVDFRLPEPLQWVLVNAEVAYVYRFKARRDAPTSASFPKRSPYFQFLYSMLALSDPDFAAMFPDLSGMGDYYDLTVGSSLDGQVALTLNPLGFVPFGVRYAAGWTQEPTIDTSSEQYVRYMKTIEVLSEELYQTVSAGAAVSLFPLHIPINVNFVYQFPVGGLGAFIVEQDWAVTTELFLAFQ